MTNIAKAKGELTTAAQELGEGYEAAGDARKKVRNCVKLQTKSIGLVDKIIASVLETNELLTQARADSTRSEELIGNATDRIGSIALRKGDRADSVSSLTPVVEKVANNQGIYTGDIQNYQVVADEFVQRLTALREDFLGWRGNLKEDARDDALAHIAFSEAVGQTSATIQEI